MNRRGAIIDVVWLLCLGIASSLWCWTAARQIGPTFDEPAYIKYGTEYWHDGSYKRLMAKGSMPLAVDLQTLPIALWEKSHGTTMPFEMQLRWARTASLAFWWLLLIYAFRAAKTVGGSWGGRIAVALLACEPVVLGHAALATSDIAVTGSLLALALEFHNARECKWPRRIILPGVLYGLAILAKASALVFGPLCLLTIECERAWRLGIFSRDRAVIAGWLRSFIPELGKIIGIGLLVVFVYCGSDWATEPTFIDWAQSLPAGKIHDAMLWVSEHLCIFSNAGEGLVQQIKHNIRGHGTFILGHDYPRAVWFYFPVCLTIKLTLALLAIPLVIAVVRRQALWNWACLIALVLLVYSLTCRVQIGVRFMLPLVAFACVGLGAAAATVLNQVPGWKRIVVAAFVIVAILSNAWATVRVWPNGICFTNIAFGGTPKGYRLLSDSNYDWGQGLPELRKWQQQHGVADLHVWYFGSDPAIRQAPFQRLRPERVSDGSVPDLVSGKLIAVSTTLLYGSYTQKPAAAQEAVALFRANRPVDRTTTFLIYDFRQSPADPAPR